MVGVHMCTKAVLKRTPLHIHTCTHIPPPPSGAGIRGWLPLETELLEDKSPRLNCLLVPSTVPGTLVIHSFVFTMHTVGVLVESNKKPRTEMSPEEPESQPFWLLWIASGLS